MHILKSLVLSLLLAVNGLQAEELVCRYSMLADGPGETSSDRKYSPSKEIDIIHLMLDVTPDFKARSVSGSMTLRFKPIAKSLSELKLDGINLNVSKVDSSDSLQGWQATDKNVILTFAQPIPADKESTVTITYSVVPHQGLYFRTPEIGYKAEDMHIWSQGEPDEARHWFPCYDAPNEKFTSEITCHVPEGMVVLSNGRQISEEKEPSGLKAVRWRQEKPHVNYLISLCAGYFKKVEDKYKDVPLAFWTPASQVSQAALSFQDTKDIMGFFEQEIGIPYPWAKYYQVCVDDFGWGGMENTSITTLNDNTLHTAASENLRSSQGLVAHEMAHQWFGDLVTCKDWAHVWLNEGFATFYDALYEGHKHGPEAMTYGFYGSAKGIFSQLNDTNSIVRRRINTPEEMFDYLAYPKGSWVLRMLRAQLGEDLYRRCIKTYVQRHQYGNAVTEDLNSIIEELSGRSFDRFFDQWVYHAHHPELGVTYSWDESAKLAKLTVTQNQKLSENVLLFQFPLAVRFKCKSGTFDRTIDVKERAGDFYFALPDAPRTVRIDPEFVVLANISFNPPANLLNAQLEDSQDMLGRLIAVEQMSGKRESLDKLKKVLQNDSFYGVRMAAAQSIRAIQSDEALAALLDSTKQPDARVRRQVAGDIAGFYREAAFAGLQKLLPAEKNPDIGAVYIQGLGAYHKPEVQENLVHYLNSDSYKNHLADAAILAIRAQDESSYIQPLMDCLAKNEQKFTSRGFAAALDTLGWLGRNEEKKDAVREFLVNRVNHKKQAVQLAVINALGNLGDARAVAVLEKFSSLPKTSRERLNAEKSIALLRDAKKPSVELGSLRTEMLAVQKENRELRKEMDDLKKKFEALAGKTEKSKTKPNGPSMKNQVGG
ncbi:MAG TPA: M1 family aminopeptidase [Verrucomicrobiae bacterium]